MADEFFNAFIVVVLAGLTDWVDGYLARLWQAETFFGRLFDPLADKFLVVGATAALGVKGYLPLLLFGVIILRDVLLVFGSFVVFLTKTPLAIVPSMVSKINTVFQFILIAAVLLFDYSYALYYPITTVHSVLSSVMTVLASVTFLTTLWSGAAYGALFVKAFRQRG